ncbi:MAG: hypothetical protein LBN36_01570, partial [Clostridiales Family XIII bacterium]|nr:hypothetical protein [Clostridiales Family XIII bacterium]
MNNKSKKKKSVPFEGHPVVLLLGTLEQNLERIRLAELEGEELEKNLRLAEDLEKARIFREARWEAMRHEQKIPLEG